MSDYQIEKTSQKVSVPERGNSLQDILYRAYIDACSCRAGQCEPSCIVCGDDGYGHEQITTCPQSIN